ncbi:hypothetical protein MJG53_011348 [Ovis ammon polii x Ovis aries]|uniref:Uncharacterized protein n=2 Tax=Ovis TaxID=9935 RepID=A0A836A7H4_SHEEP|nr:hypothetical protein JEQ12_003947 [Ovis aries]KAI4563334.1 hypothetical protein MJT46_010943 [Ovis ammon polii x Ovis aries]KAI4578493.1 hypothetical protein MJG53_011348 [Ovis ammon polii x Ovis aries]
MAWEEPLDRSEPRTAQLCWRPKPDLGSSRGAAPAGSRGRRGRASAPRSPSLRWTDHTLKRKGRNRKIPKMFSGNVSPVWHVGSYFPNRGSNLCPLHRECGVLTSGPPEKSSA